jgi:hypothetical protein
MRLGRLGGDSSQATTFESVLDKVPQAGPFRSPCPYVESSRVPSRREAL